MASTLVFWTLKLVPASRAQAPKSSSSYFWMEACSGLRYGMGDCE